MSSPSPPLPLTETISPREAIAAAAQARLVASSRGTGTEAESQRAREEADHLQKCRRIIDLQIRRDNGYEKALECLKTLDTLISNILNHPTEDKYRSFRSANPKLQRTVLTVPGGTAYLLQAGFGTRTVEFKQEWFLHPSVQPRISGSSTGPPQSSDPESPSTSNSPETIVDPRWRRLELAHRALRDRLVESEERVRKQREMTLREQEVERNRAARVLEEAQEDRQRVALRALREKQRRERGEGSQDGDAHSPAGHAGSSGSTRQAYQQPPGGIPNYQVNTSTLVGARTGGGDSESTGEDHNGSAGIDSSDYTTEVPFDDPSARGEDADLDEEDEEGNKPPPYGREEWGTGRRLGS